MIMIIMERVIKPKKGKGKAEEKKIPSLIFCNSFKKQSVLV